MRNVFLDTETCGLCGPAIILQYAFDDGPIHIHEFWREPVKDSIKLLDEICQCNVVGFNLSFDWFQLIKIYNMLLLSDPDSVPEMLDFDSWAYREYEALSGPCLKPASAFDLMLHARKTKYQSTMERNDIRIRRVPTPLAFKLAEELEKRVTLGNILFARRKNTTAPRWAVFDIKRTDGHPDPNFKDVVLKFKPSTALKALAQDALGIQEDAILLFQDIEVDKTWLPKEIAWAPYALAVGNPSHWRGAWPSVIEHHIDHWAFHDLARTYASNDVLYTRGLWEHFNCPEGNDDDSVLACAVAACRFRGYAVDIDAIKERKAEEFAKLGKYPTAPGRAKAMLLEHLSSAELAIAKLHRGTGKIILEEIASWDNQECPFGPCEECNETGRLTHPASIVAKGILESRKAVKKIEIYDKLIHAKRFFASFKVIGTLSTRMAGTDGINPQGIPHEKNVRKCFPLADQGLDLEGGDFESFEVTLADAAYNDETLRKDLLTKGLCPGCKGQVGSDCSDCKGTGETKQKIHALFAMGLAPGKSYADIVATKGSSLDLYDMGKRGIFGLMYGGNANTLVTKLGVSLEIAQKVEAAFVARYPNVGRSRKAVFDKFCSMRQEGGIGTRVVWNEPAEYIESLFGFRRYFSLENAITRSLYELANNPPKDWRKINITVMRRDREQTASGALQSALYAAAFGIQSSNMRAAANHVIQSSGAQVTKSVQRSIWNLQPIGSCAWKVQPMNIHDEILCPTAPDYVDKVAEVVKKAVESFRPKVPLIEIGWNHMNTWADK